VSPQTPQQPPQDQPLDAHQLGVGHVKDALASAALGYGVLAIADGQAAQPFGVEAEPSRKLVHSQLTGGRHLGWCGFVRRLAIDVA
jgi:hypothetical protein